MKSAPIVSIDIRQLELPLIVPYVLSYRTFTSFEPYIVVVRDADGRCGFGEGHVSPGSSSETREDAWEFLMHWGAWIAGKDPEEILSALDKVIEQSPVATTALACAVEMLMSPDVLKCDAPTRFALLAPVSGTTAQELEVELEQKLLEGFGTFKVKVGKDVDDDLRRLVDIQTIVDGRATLRLDANRAYSRKQAFSFCTNINPDGIELFEQPCDANDWDANAAVASVSRVPLMLDEPICTLKDIDRAATIPGVGYLKIKLKRFGGLQRLRDALVAIRRNDMIPVLGDGLGAEIACWMEALLAVGHIDNAGEFNGYLKPSGGVLKEPPGFDNGALVLPAGFSPQLDVDKFDNATQKRVELAG